MIQHDKLSGQYQIHLSRDGYLDKVEVHCELEPSLGNVSDAERQQIGEWVAHRIKTLVGISTRVCVLPPDSIERTLVGKARRVVDHRPKDV